MVGNQETAPTYSSLAHPVGRTRHGGHRSSRRKSRMRDDHAVATYGDLHLHRVHGILRGRKTLPKGRERERENPLGLESTNSSSLIVRF